MGFIIHFYITFGTNLLTGGPAQICCFMPISVFRAKGYQTKSKRNEINWRCYFWKENNPGNLECMSGEIWAAHEGGGAPLGTPPASWGPRSSSDVPPAPIYTLVH